MTWEWVVLILGLLFIVFAFSIAFTFARRETYEHRKGPMFSPTVTRRSGLDITIDERKDELKNELNLDLEPGGN